VYEGLSRSACSSYTSNTTVADIQWNQRRSPRKFDLRPARERARI
jgi:hypothetical protein